MRELRALVSYFRSEDGEFSLWIAGYIMLASRLGWRPGEILILQREGSLLRARAEKQSNQRGLTDTCEIDFSACLEKFPLIKRVSLISDLDRGLLILVNGRRTIKGCRSCMIISTLASQGRARTPR